MRLINQVSTEARNIVDSDAVGHSSSPIVTFQGDLPTEEQEYLASSIRSDSDSTISDIVLLSIPRDPVVGLSEAPSDIRSLHIPPISECSTRSSSMSIVDYDDDNWSRAVHIDSVPPSQLGVPSLQILGGRVGFCEFDCTQRRCSKLLHTNPLPFLDDSESVIAAVPLRDPKPMNMLPGLSVALTVYLRSLTLSLSSSPCSLRLQGSVVRRLALEVNTGFLVD